MEKHAYLILAHNNFYILERLVKLLDYEFNDIYIHIDKKVRDFRFNYFKNIVTKSKIFFVKRFNIKWGGYNQVKAELELLEEASKKNYAYYHILSGVDMPLKKPEEIYNFFKKNNGKEFVNIEKISNNSWRDTEIKNRVKLYHFLDNIINLRSENKLIILLKNIYSHILNLQVKLGINRYKDDIWYGSNWCSITNECVKYILENKKLIKKMYKFTHAADELFIQNIVANNSKLMNNIFKWEKDSNVRLIDWNRGTPYVFNSCNFEELINSDMLFARKFDCNIDKEIVDKIYAYLMD